MDDSTRQFITDSFQPLNQNVIELTKEVGRLAQATEDQEKDIIEFKGDIKDVKKCINKMPDRDTHIKLKRRVDNLEKQRLINNHSRNSISFDTIKNMFPYIIIFIVIVVALATGHALDIIKIFK